MKEFDEIDDIHSDLIDRHLRGELNPSEQGRFEDELAADSALYSAFEERRDIVRGIRDISRAAFREKAEKELERFERWGWLGNRLLLRVLVFAVMAGLLWFGFARFFTHKEPSEPQMETPALTPSDSSAVAEQPKPEEDVLGISGKETSFSDKAVVLNTNGQPTEKIIEVTIFVNSGSGEVKYVFDGVVLHFHVPTGKDLPSPPVLIIDNSRIFLQTPDGNRLLKPDKELHNL